MVNQPGKFLAAKEERQLERCREQVKRDPEPAQDDVTRRCALVPHGLNCPEGHEDEVRNWNHSVHVPHRHVFLVGGSFEVLALAVPFVWVDAKEAAILDPFDQQ